MVVLTRMLHRDLVSPRTYRNKLSALERVIESEKDGLQRSRREAERIAQLIESMGSDRKEIDRLQRVCEEEGVGNGGKEKEEGVSRETVDRIFQSFDFDSISISTNPNIPSIPNTLSPNPTTTTTFPKPAI